MRGCKKVWGRTLQSLALSRLKLSAKAKLSGILTFCAEIPDLDKKVRKNLFKKVSLTISFLCITFHSELIGPPFQKHFFFKI